MYIIPIKMGRTRSGLTLKLRRIGTGQGVLVPKTICKIIGVEVGDEISVLINGNKVTLRSLPKEK